MGSEHDDVVGHQNPLINRRWVLRRGGLLGAAAIAGPGLLAATSAGGTVAAGRQHATTAAAQPRRGGTLVMGVPYNPAGLDPYFFRLTDTVVDLNLYTRLVEYDDDLVPHPSGAESWEVAADGLSVVVTLAADQVFHSGKDVTADDLVAGVQRAMDPDAGGQLYGASGFLAGGEAVDDRRVRITFGQPTAESTLTDWMCRFALIEADKNDPALLQTEPAGSGPFRLVDFRPGVSVELARHDGYFEDGLPYLDEVHATIFDDTDPLVGGLESSELDCATYIPFRTVSALESSYRIFPTRTLGTLTDNVAVNPTVPPFDNKLLRQAIARAINRERIVEQVAYGLGEPIFLPYLPASPVYDTSAEEQLAYDLDAARDLWEQAGRPDSGEALVQGASDEVQQALQIIQSDLREIGFTLEITALEQQTFTDRLRSGDRGLVFYGSGGNLLNPAAKGVNPDLSVTENPVWGDQIPPAFVEAMNDAAGAADETALAEASGRIREILLDECWFIGAKSRVQLAAASENVNDLGYGSPDGHLNLTRTWIDS